MEQKNKEAYWYTIPVIFAEQLIFNLYIFLTQQLSSVISSQEYFLILIIYVTVLFLFITFLLITYLFT
jgi:hypothetical protein